MTVWMIWATNDEGVSIWLVAAWDDDTISDNREGWLEEIEKAEKEHGGRNIRITKTSVNFDKVQAAFMPTEI